MSVPSRVHENFKLKHTKPGVALDGQCWTEHQRIAVLIHHSRDGQARWQACCVRYVAVMPLKAIDLKLDIFAGEVVEAMEAVKTIEAYRISSGKTKATIKIARSGAV